MVNQLQQLIPKVKGTPIIVNIERILQPVTDFIRGNPIVSTAIVGAGTSGLVVAARAVTRARKSRVKRRKKSSVKKRKKKRTAAELRRLRLRNLAKARRVKKSGVRKRKTHRSPRHRGHKKVSFTTKGGKKVSFLVAPKAGRKHKK